MRKLGPRLWTILVLGVLMVLPGCVSPERPEEECAPRGSEACQINAVYFVHLQNVALSWTTEGAIRVSFELVGVKEETVVVEHASLLVTGGDFAIEALVYPGNLSGHDRYAAAIEIPPENSTETPNLIQLSISYHRPSAGRVSSITHLTWTTSCHRLQGNEFVHDPDADPSGDCDPDSPQSKQGIAPLYGIDFTWRQGTAFLAPPDQWEKWREICPHCGSPSDP